MGVGSSWLARALAYTSGGQSQSRRIARAATQAVAGIAPPSACAGCVPPSQARGPESAAYGPIVLRAGGPMLQNIGQEDSCARRSSEAQVVPLLQPYGRRPCNPIASTQGNCNAPGAGRASRGPQQFVPRPPPRRATPRDRRPSQETVRASIPNSLVHALAAARR